MPIIQNAKTHSFHDFSSNPNYSQPGVLQQVHASSYLKVKTNNIQSAMAACVRKTKSPQIIFTEKALK